MGELLFFVNDKGFAMCLEARTGKEVWRKRMAAAVSASPVLVDGKVYAVTEAGDVYVIEASPEKYKLLGKSSVGEAVRITVGTAEDHAVLDGALSAVVGASRRR